MLPIWDSSALFEADRVYLSAEFDGDAPTGLPCVVATTKGGCAFLSSVVGKQIRAVASFVITKSEIIDPTEYANGGDLKARPIEKRKIPVYVHNNVCLVPVDREVPRSFASLLFTTLKPTDVTVLHSVHSSLFHGDADIPSLFSLSGGDEEPRFPAPNIVTGIAAGILSYAECYNVKCRSLEVVEDDFGATRDSLMLWAKALTPVLALDVDKVLSDAVQKVVIEEESLGLIYS